MVSKQTAQSYEDCRYSDITHYSLCNDTIRRPKPIIPRYEVYFYRCVTLKNMKLEHVLPCQSKVTTLDLGHPSVGVMPDNTFHLMCHEVIVYVLERARHIQ